MRGGCGRRNRNTRDYTWRSERQLILTFLSENQSAVIPEAACVISPPPSATALPLCFAPYAPLPTPFFDLFLTPRHTRRPFSILLFSLSITARVRFAISLDASRLPFLRHLRASNLLLIAATKKPRGKRREGSKCRKSERNLWLMR